MNPKSHAFFSACLLALAALIVTAGCATATRSSSGTSDLPKGVPTYALAVAVRGGVEPTPAQWNAMYDKFAQALAARGLLLINDYARAEHIINIEFLPDPSSPTRGTALITSIVDNTALAKSPVVARTTYNVSYASSNASFDPFWSSSYGYDRYNPYGYGSYGYGSYGYGYGGYGYGGYYDNYGSVGSGHSTTPPTTTPVTPPPVTPVTPPTHHHRPPNTGEHPPGTTPYLPPPSYVGHHPRHPPPEGGRIPPASYTPSPASHQSSSSYDSSHRSSYSSSNDSSYRSSYSPPSDSSSYSSSSSYSAPSYSAPSYSAPAYSPPAQSSSSSSSSNNTGSDTNSRSQPN